MAMALLIILVRRCTAQYRGGARAIVLTRMPNVPPIDVCSHQFSCSNSNTNGLNRP